MSNAIEDAGNALVNRATGLAHLLRSPAALGALVADLSSEQQAAFLDAWWLQMQTWGVAESQTQMCRIYEDSQKRAGAAAWVSGIVGFALDAMKDSP